MTDNENFRLEKMKCDMSKNAGIDPELYKRGGWRSLQVGYVS